uniref:L antigen family member 3 n=1 Tax=Steinernema glaseri TaxID=37863 RepID=A0A1I7Z391_9BILA
MNGDDSVSTSSASHPEHSACIRLDFGTEEKASMICRTLAVDKEPKRSCAVRNMRAEGTALVVDITCNDAKFLQKSIQNMFDMADLARQTFDKVGSYEYKSSENVPAPEKKKGKSS